MSRLLRFAIPVLLAVAAIGCRGAQPGRLPDDRDYTSLNRSSYAFLKETIKQGDEMRARSLANTVDVIPRWENNLRIQRESRRFAGETFIKDEARNWREMLGRVEDELSFDPDAWAGSARFGFLDSGE